MWVLFQFVAFLNRRSAVLCRQGHPSPLILHSAACHSHNHETISHHPFPPKTFGRSFKTVLCGDDVADNGDGVCDMACSGNSDEICGGSYALSIYSYDPDYLGCWSDPHTADTRLFSILIASSEDMTTAVRNQRSRTADVLVQPRAL